nr:hypothetical protein BaRGS_004096 [Batillaria attramentaria]
MGLLDVPGISHKRQSSPNIAHLAARISQAELNKLRMLGGGTGVGGSVASDRSSRPPSLRRKMFDNLTINTSLPSINLNDGELPLKSPESDYPEDDHSPADGQDQRQHNSHNQLGGNNIYKPASDTSTTYNNSHQGAGSDETRSTNTDGGLDEDLKEDPNIWRPYDMFQVSEREPEDDGAVFREILKAIRLVLYFFITVTVLGGTVVSRLSLYLLASGISQDEKSRGESVVMILFCVCSPIVISWLFAFMKIMFSGKRWPSVKTFIVMLILELLQTFGVCLLVFRVMPVTDFFRGITITLAMFQFPALFKLVLMERKPRLGVWDCLKLLLALLAFLTQVAAIPFFLMTKYPAEGVHSTVPVKVGQSLKSESQLPDLCWELPVALVLVSLGWWENYVSGEWSMCGKVKLSFQRARKIVQDVRETVFFLVAPFKIGLTILLARYLTGATFLLPQKEADDDTDPVEFHLTCYSLLYLQIGATGIVTYLASLACKLHMQKTAFALPLLLSPPASLAVVYLQCRYEFLPTHWHMGWWFCPSIEVSDLVIPLSCAGALWISYCLIVSHVWFPRSERMAKVERLFTTPHFDAIFPDFHLTLRRRRNDRELRTTRLERFTYVGDDYTSEDEEDRKENSDVTTPMVYVCATMWHETRREMTQLLKSLFRLDYVHCASKLAQDKFRIRDPDYFDLEVHVMFDDAFELDEESDRYVPNIFVRQLIECMEDAARSVVKGPIEIPPPVKSPTPYGGRLVWTMPGQTKMYVHLKNKNLIRHRKRWSQCMYLYYLLGYRLLGGKDEAGVDAMMDADSDHKTSNLRQRGDKTKDKDKTKAKSKAKRRKTAASMPLRSLMAHMSPEKYEKTIQMSENTFILTLDGDVDFKPDSVKLLLDRMKKNKKVGAVCGRIHPIGSGPMVWYQQFEYAVGHWLQKASEHVFGCVLCCPGCFSLFRGSALMDDNVMKKYTTKPTEAAHYIQFEQGEDRWLCTLLLQQGHRIDYSAGADALTFAPETFNEFFNQRRRWSPSTLANMMDLLSSWRETVAINDNVSRLYILYQFLLMASSILAPSTVMLMITGSFHSVLGISIWWSFILSMVPVVFYLVVCLTQKNDLQIQIGAVLTAVYTVVMMIATVGTLISIATESFGSPNVVFLSGLFVIFVVAAILHPQEFFCLVYGALYFLVVPSTFILLTVYYLCNLNNVSWGTREVPKKLTPEELEQQKKAEEEKAKKKKKNIFSLYGFVSLVHELRDAIRVGYEPNPDSPYWLNLDYLGFGMMHHLNDEESEFWRFLIKKYLFPLDEDKGQKKKIAEDLAIIRNNVVFIYVMMNFLWCVIALQVQAMEDTLKTFYIVQKYEPLSLVFLSIFALVLLLQFLSMLVHRWGTFLHLMSSTRIDWCKKTHSEEEFARFVVSETQKLQNLEPLPDYEDEEDSDEDGMSLSDFDASLHHHETGDKDTQKPSDGDTGIYETLNSYRTLTRYGQHRPAYPYPYPGQLHRMTSTTGEFPMLKTIFEQNLENLQHWWKNKGTVAGRAQGRAPARWGTQRRYFGDRQGEMRQRFFNQNFQMPVHSGDRLFV